MRQRGGGGEGEGEGGGQGGEEGEVCDLRGVTRCDLGKCD